MVSRRVTLAIGLGLLAAAASVAIVLGTEDASSGPGRDRARRRGRLARALLRRDRRPAPHGVPDHRRLRRLSRRGGCGGARAGFAAVAAIALAASLLFTATYHLGYSDFRSAKVRKPVAGDLIWAAPVIATANPIGAPIAHAGLHVAAVTHSSDTDLFLPPH